MNWLMMLVSLLLWGFFIALVVLMFRVDFVCTVVTGG